MPERVNSSNSLATGDNLNIEFESVKEPKNTDILCGKDKRCIKHEGSRDFRKIIESYTSQYQMAASRQEKMDITKQIFDRLQSRRFLKFNDDTDMWETLHPLAVRDKIGHALRFSNRKGSGTIRNKVRSSGSLSSILSNSSLASSDRLTDHLNRRSTASTGNLMNFGRQNAQWRTKKVSQQQNASWTMPALEALRLSSPDDIGSGMTRPSAALSGLNGLSGGLNGLSGGLHGSIGGGLHGGLNGRLGGGLGGGAASRPPRQISNQVLNQSQLAPCVENQVFNNHHTSQLENQVFNQTTSQLAPCVEEQVSSLNQPSQPLAPLAENKDDEDLSWMLTMPLMEMKPDGKVYFAS